MDDQFCMDIVDGVKKWAIAKHAMDSIDDIADGDKIIVVSMKMSPKKCQVIFTAKNLLKLLGEEVVVVSCDSACDFTCGRWRLHVLGAMDERHHVYPAGYMLASNEDTDSCTCLIESLRNLCDSGMSQTCVAP